MTTSKDPIRVLFLCTHNSARSILSEALLNHLGAGRFVAYSAGSSPRENQQPNPFALEVLRSEGVATEGLYSKSWDTFAQSDVPRMDLIITVCHNAAGEVCPIWPGHPTTTHWGFADPSLVSGSDEDQRAAFMQTLQAIRQHLQQFLVQSVGAADIAAVQAAAKGLTRS